MQPTVRLRMSRLYRYHAAGTVGERAGSCHGLEPSPIHSLPATDGSNVHWVCRTEARAEEPSQGLDNPRVSHQGGHTRPSTISPTIDRQCGPFPEGFWMNSKASLTAVLVAGSLLATACSSGSGSTSSSSSASGSGAGASSGSGGGSGSAYPGDLTKGKHLTIYVEGLADPSSGFFRS